MGAAVTPAEAKQAAADLRAAQALISTHEKWTKHYGARDQAGANVDVDSRDAVCWCMAGAVYRITKKFDSPAAICLRAVVGPISVWNDAPSRTHVEVMGAFERAIAFAESEVSR